MPLFMEFHKAANLTMAELQRRAVREQLMLREAGVHYHQLWMNEEGGSLFCLIEGPDRKSCERVHSAVCGTSRFSLTAVTECLPNGEAVREDFPGPDCPPVLMVVKLVVASRHRVSPDTALSFYRRAFLQCVQRANAVTMSCGDEFSLAAYFTNDLSCAECCSQIVGFFQSINESSVSWRLIMLPANGGENESNELLLAARNIAAVMTDRRVCLFRECGRLAGLIPSLSARLISRADTRFVHRLGQEVAAHVGDEAFNVDALSRAMALSRPQLYRKVLHVSGVTPHVLLRDARMDRAYSLLKHSSQNVCEVALEVGYANPSNFAKAFSERYGYTPSSLLHDAAGGSAD